ncbi:MAG TPA: FAD-dependent oxidoreductase [Ktedonobacterales bacterium]
MRVGIIGGGASGLITAWLLEGQHAVTLFEKQARLGGHAQTIQVEQEGRAIGIDAGFEFFSPAMFPLLTRLLKHSGVAVRQFPMTLTLYTPNQRKVSLIPPIRNRRVVWSAFALRPLADMLQFLQVINRGLALMQSQNTSLTLEQFLTSLPLTAAFKREFLYPLFLAGWCLDLEEFKGFSAYNILSYYSLNRPSGLSAKPWTEVEGGTQVYIQALTQALSRAEIKLQATITRVARAGQGYTIHLADGSAYEFDHLVLATNAPEARDLLAPLAGQEALTQLLGAFEYFKTTIAVHGDLRLMPARKDHWSVVNMRFDGTHSSATVWKHWKSRTPILKSWITYEDRLPEPLFALAAYVHPKVTPAYFQAQTKLAAFQGQDRLWLVGVYTQGVDCHESAIGSAIRVAQQLAPHSPRLKLLLMDH